MSEPERRDETLPLVTNDELDLTLLVRHDRYLTVEYRMGDTVRKDRFPIRGSADIDSMMRWLVLERRLNEALDLPEETAEQQEFAAEQLTSVLEDGLTEIQTLLSEKTADAPRPLMDVQQMLLTLKWLAGDASVADAVAKAITAGSAIAKEKDAVTTADDTTDGDGSTGEGVADVPLVSNTSSQRPSSGSDEPTDGDPNGGAESPGEPSVSTFSTPTSD